MIVAWHEAQSASRQKRMTPDSQHNHWISRFPGFVQPYLRLARLDRPIGSWLLFWPCVWGVLLPSYPLGAKQLWLCLLLGLGSVAMRGAGCVWNDILDRDIDAQIERTKARPIPAGEVSIIQALLFMAMLCVAGLAVLLALTRTAQLAALAAVPLVALYPLMKRITWWPQAWLGLTFNWGALVGYAAMTNDISTAALLLYAGGLFWTLGYDTIYALQDIEDDALVGVKSSARRLGDSVRIGVLIFYTICIALISGALVWQGGIVAALCGGGFAVHLIWQWTGLTRAGITIAPAVALQLFRSNAVAGGLLAVGLAVFRVFQS
jgi:4-hydroxybenzoate polyprenyltransferase